MTSVSDSRKSINVLIRKDLLDAARDPKIDLSAELEKQLEKRVREVRAKSWLEDNREAIAAYNRHFEEHGIWNETIRLW